MDKKKRGEIEFESFSFTFDRFDVEISRKKKLTRY